jgi:uncharacterized protein (TIGR02246 family)
MDERSQRAAGNHGVDRQRRGRRALLVLLVVSAACAHEATAQGAPQRSSPEALAAARASWNTLDSIWNTRDAVAFSGLFEENASFVFVDRGVALETRTTILRHFTDQFAEQSSELRHATEVREGRMIAPGVLAADVEIEVQRDGSAASGSSTVLRRFAAFAVMRRSGNGWRIELLRVYTLAPPVGGP